MIKTLHITCAALSFLGFVIRGWWMWRDSPCLHHRMTRILPHCIDTLLLISALGLVWLYRLSPPQHPWLISKVLVLVLYIGLGTVALKRGKTKAKRMVAFGFAVLSFGFIVAAAFTKSAWGYLGLF